MDRINAFSPFKIGAQLTPEEIFLLELSILWILTLKTIDGMKLDNGVQQEELAKLVFSDPEWQRGL